MLPPDGEPIEEICLEIEPDEDRSPGEENPLVQQTQVTEPAQIRSNSWRLLDVLAARPSSSLAALHRTLSEREEEVSLSSPSPPSSRSHGHHLHVHFIRRVNWQSLLKNCKEWLANPMNVALLIWLICVALSSSMLGLLLVGLLDRAFPSRGKRNYWIEINNQVLNALFTLMSLYQHPNLFHHLVLLCRWSPEDVAELRKIYCKDGGADRPRDRTHMALVLALLHVSCFSQYVLCGLYWEYTSDERPEAVENTFVVVGMAAPVLAGLYTIYSPLGRERIGVGDGDGDEESPVPKRIGLKPNALSFPVARPEWAGGLLDCHEDATVGLLSLFCTFCVFGWNMERLGFGNMYIHAVTFLLLFIAPLFIFGISSLNIHNDVIADVTAVAGRALSVFCLLYGGFWRIQIRKRFKLPGSRFCCGSETLTDYFQWMFCWACSLAQEVRTGNLYDVEDGGLYEKRSRGDEGGRPCLQPLAREEGKKKKLVRTECDLLGNGDMEERRNRVARVEEEEPTVMEVVEKAMLPPSRPIMEPEEGERFVGDGAGGSSSPI